VRLKVKLHKGGVFCTLKFVTNRSPSHCWFCDSTNCTAYLAFNCSPAITLLNPI
jgi:hypothetical protein